MIALKANNFGNRATPVTGFYPTARTHASTQAAYFQTHA
jgi:hypothetical protein